MDFIAARLKQVANALASIGLIWMLRFGQSIEEQRQIETVVQLVNVHLEAKCR